MRQKIVAVADDALLAMSSVSCIERGHGLRELFGKRIQVLAGIADAGPAVCFSRRTLNCWKSDSVKTESVFVSKMATRNPL